MNATSTSTSNLTIHSILKQSEIDWIAVQRERDSMLKCFRLGQHFVLISWKRCISAKFLNKKRKKKGRNGGKSWLIWIGFDVGIGWLTRWEKPCISLTAIHSKIPAQFPTGCQPDINRTSTGFISHHSAIKMSTLLHQRLHKREREREREGGRGGGQRHRRNIRLETKSSRIS